MREEWQKRLDYYNELKARLEQSTEQSAEVEQSLINGGYSQEVEDYSTNVVPAVEAVNPQPANETRSVKRTVSRKSAATMMPETADEFVATVMPKITPESFRRETGMSNSEQRLLVGYIAGADKGGVSIEQAAEMIMENYGDELHGLGFAGDVQDMRNMIIDILSNGNPKGYIKRSRALREMQLEEEERQRADAWAYGMGFDSYEEYLDYTESLLQKIEELLIGFDETEYYNNLAENYEYDTTRESENIGRGGELLQGEQSVTSTPSEVVGAGNEGTAVPGDVRSGGDNALAQGETIQVNSSEFPNNQSAAEGNAPGQSGVVENNNANALQNGNNELNLQQNDTDNGYQDNTPVGGQVLQSVPQGEHREVTPLSRGAQEAAARLRERIEGAQGNSKSGLREVENSVTREFAQENGLWIENETELGTPFPSGDEHNNYIDAVNQVVYKVNNRMHTPSILELLDRMEQHNKSFPNTPYKLVGFTSVSKNGDVMPVFAQDFVPDARMATVEEIDGYMGTLGFDRVGDGRYSNGEVVIKDLKPRNVLVDPNGDVYVVDAEFEQEQRAESKEESEIQEPRFVREELENGDVWITSYNSRGEVATVATERDGKVVSVDSYDEGVLHSHSEYDENGKATSATFFDKDGNVIGTRTYVNGVESGAYVREAMRTAPLRARAEKWMRDTGVPVRLIGIGDEITNSAARRAINAGEKVTGWIDNNEVVIYLPNISNKKEIDDTFVHEVVAHKGLKALMGEDFDTLCDRVWEMMSEEQKAHYINYPGVNGDTRKAADEYMAHLAEGVDLTEQDKTVWQRIVDAVREFLVKHGMKMADGDIENLIRASYAKLREQSADNRVQSTGTQFRIAEVNERFNNELQQQIDGTLPKGHIYELGMPSEVLRSAGLPNLPIELAASRLSDKSMQENHPFELSEIKGLVEAVQKPLAVFRSATRLGSFVVLTEIQHEGKNYVVAIETNRKRGKIEINSVRSVYPKNNTQVANWIEEGLLEYADKKRMSEWLSKQRSNSADVRNLFRHSAKLVESFENPTIESENTLFRTTYHGSGAKFDRFDHSFMGTGEGAQAFGWGTYVTEVEGIGRQYAESTSGNIFKGGFGDFYLKKIREDLAEGKGFEEIKQNLLDRDADLYEKLSDNRIDDGYFIHDYEKLQSLKEEDLPKRNLYTVEVPDDNGSNYLHWEANNTKETIDKLNMAYRNMLLERGVPAEDISPYFEPFSKGLSGESIYKLFARELGGDKAASLFLNDMGFVGISYPANATTGGRADGARNYVIFNENDAQIENHTQFRIARTPQEFDATQKEAVEKRGIVAPDLNDAVVNVVDVPRHDFTGNLKEARTKAREWAIENYAGKEFDLPENAGKYIISKNAIGKYLDKSAFDKSDNAAVHLSALKVLPEIISNSVEAEIHPDYAKGENGARSAENGINRNDLLVHRIYGAINIDGKTYRVKTTIHEFKDSNTATTPHSYEVTEIELIEDSTVTPYDGIDNPLNRSVNSISATKLLDGVEKSYDKGKKVLDESEISSDIRFRVVGGNSGYVGYSMSKRAEQARAKGRYPKTDFKKVYGVSGKSFDLLKEAGIIYISEWHHTSKFGNETDFYSWDNETDAGYYAANKKRIDKAVNDVEKLKPGYSEWEAIGKYLAQGRSQSEIRDLIDEELRRVEPAEKAYKDARKALVEQMKDEFYDFYEQQEKKDDDVRYRISEDVEVPRLTKKKVEKIFGGIWIDDAEEFAKFASAVNNSPFEENGEGVAYTDNYFYAYYLNIDGQVIPFASVYLNSLESQEVVNRYNQEIKENGKQRRVREYIDRAYELAWNIQSKRDAEFGIDKGASNPRRNDSLDSNISRKGRYYDRPDLYVKTKRADRFGIVERSGSGPLTDREITIESDPYSKAMGRPRYTGKKQREYVARQRDRMAQRVEDLAKKLHLDNVEVVTDASVLDDKQAKSKGFYSKSTGKITIVIPNHSSTFDVEQTLLHEAVAHYGLRRLFGEHFDTFLDNVFNSADEDVRRRITELAIKKYDFDFRTATEEYLAGLAEDMDFENANRKGWWGEIKELFLKLLHRIGFDGFSDVTLTDNELRYILWRSYESLAEPGRYRSILGEVADMAKQYELGVGNYASGKLKTENGKVAAEDDVLFRVGDPEMHERELARDRYERRVKSGMFQSREALQDSMLGLKEAMQAILGKSKYIEDVDGFENAYLAENRLSSVNKAEADAFARLLFKPMLDEVARLAPTEMAREELTEYMMAKHGLERNEYMRKQAEQNGEDSDRDFAGAYNGGADEAG